MSVGNTSNVSNTVVGKVVAKGLPVRLSLTDNSGTWEGVLDYCENFHKEKNPFVKLFLGKEKNGKFNYININHIVRIVELQEGQAK